ncbi:MAG: response regulator [Bacteroidota bacterium]
MKTIKVILTDDHELFREGLRKLIEAVSPDIEICALAADGEEAIRLAEQEHPDVVLMDLAMPGMGGVEAVRRLKQIYPNLPVAVLTTYDEEDLVVAAIQAGAAGYLLKDMSGRDLAEAIRKLNSGKHLIDPEIAVRMIQEIPARHEPGQPLMPRRTLKQSEDNLSPREMQILRMLAEGKGNKEVAETFGISEGTAKNYTSRIYAKLGVSDRAQAVAYAIRYGLVK